MSKRRGLVFRAGVSDTKEVVAPLGRVYVTRDKNGAVRAMEGGEYGMDWYIDSADAERVWSQAVAWAAGEDMPQ